MKRKILIIVLLVICTFSSWAQNKQQHWGKEIHRSKLEELEKIKLIESLNLDEETAVRFIARRSEHMRKMKDIMDEREKLIENLEADIRDNKKENDDYWNKRTEQILSLDGKTIELKKQFYTSLEEIFTKKQIARLIAFEHVFRRELRETILNKGRGFGRRLDNAPN